MKNKVFILISFIIIVFVLSACQKTSNKQVSQNQNTETQSLTGNWKTYINTKYGYQISYPADIYTMSAFTTKEPIDYSSAGSVSFFKISDLNSAKVESAFTINVFPNPQKLSAEDYLKQNYQKWLGSSSSYSDFYINEPIAFNGLSGIKFGTKDVQVALFTKKEFAFTITATDLDVIKTFKFTD